MRRSDCHGPPLPRPFDESSRILGSLTVANARAAHLVSKNSGWVELLEPEATTRSSPSFEIQDRDPKGSWGDAISRPLMAAAMWWCWVRVGYFR